MGTIPQELETFKATVEPSLDSMSSAATKIVEKVTESVNASNSAKDGISTYYNSQNKQTVLSRFDKLKDIYGKISNSVSSDLQSMLSGAKEVIDLVNELIKINQEIEEQQKIVNSEPGDTEESKRKKDEAQSIINTKNNEFETKKEEALQKLNNLKAMDASISFVEEFSSNDSYESNIDNLQGGHMEHGTFQASNGVTLGYHVYVPDYGDAEIQDLPINMYLHGSSESGGGVLTIGLPQMLSQGTITPSGLVVCPQLPSYDSFEDPAYQQALVELTGEIAKNYNGDTDRVSLSGHSIGAIAGYDLINNYPGYFSAFVPISGTGEYTPALNDVKIWAFHGAGDTQGNRTNYSRAKSLISQLQRMGAEAYLHTFQDMGHQNTQNRTFQGEYQDSDGEMINPIEWALRQKKENA